MSERGEGKRKKGKSRKLKQERGKLRKGKRIKLKADNSLSFTFDLLLERFMTLGNFFALSSFYLASVG
jgi:hypothetical protein